MTPNSPNRYPSLAIYHPNGKGTGAAARFALIPARVGDPNSGFIYLRLARQTGDASVPHYDNVHDLDAELDFDSLGKMLEVFRGCAEYIDDGKGIYQRGELGAWKQVVKLEHKIEPAPGYWLEIARSYNEKPDAPERIGIFLRPHEAMALSLAIEDSLAAVCFGISEWRMA